MRKLIIIFLFISSICYSQNFDLMQNQTNGLYSRATNNVTVMGVSAGNILIPADFTISDTSSNWSLLPNSTNYKYSLVTNTVTFMGQAPGTVQVPVSFQIGSSSSIPGTYFSTSNLDTSNLAKRNAQNTFTQNQKVPVLAVGSSGINPIPRVAVGITVGDSNMIGFNLVNTTLNTVRTSQVQSTDTSSASIRLTRWTGQPMLDFVNNLGVTTAKIDSAGNGYFTRRVLGLGDTLSFGINSTANLNLSGTRFFPVSNRGVTLGSTTQRFAGLSMGGTLDNQFATGVDISLLRGSVDTDITGLSMRTPNGTLYYAYINDAGAWVMSTSPF